jgi:hypothetical protein
MRKMILIGTMVLLTTAAAQAGETRSLSLATTEQSVTRPADNGQRTADATQPTAAAEAPQPAPAPVPAQSAAAPVAGAPATQPPSRMSRPSHAARASTPRSKRWTEARIVSELHRHGIYW